MLQPKKLNTADSKMLKLIALNQISQIKMNNSTQCLFWFGLMSNIEKPLKMNIKWPKVSTNDHYSILFDF